MAAYAEKKFWDRVWDRQKEYESKRAVHTDAKRDEIVNLIRPDLLAGLLDELHDKEGSRTGDLITEGTPPWSALTWARGFQSNMVGRKIVWARRVVEENPDPKIREIIKFKGNDEVNAYQQALDEHMSMVYRKSNFYDLIPEYILDGGSVGSPVMIPEHDVANSRINCITPHYSQCYWDRDYFGRDSTLHVLHEMSAVQAMKFFGEENLPNKIKKSLKEGQQYQRHTFLQTIYAAGDPIMDDLPAGDEVKITHPWMDFYFYQAADENERMPMKRGTPRPGYKAAEAPWNAWHYSRKSGELYARTPAWWAIQDVKGLYASTEAYMEGLEKNVRKPMWSIQELEGLLDYGPGGENYATDRESYGMPPVEIGQTVDYRAGAELMNHFIEATKRHYHINLFVMLEGLAQNKQPVTAFQIFKMEGERQSQLIPAIETFENGLLARIDSRFIEIERRAGRLPVPPDILLEFGTGEVNTEFVGPLSTSQIRQQSIGRIHNGLAAVDPMLERFPEGVHKINWELLIERTLEAANMDQDVIVGSEEFEATLDALKQRQLQAELAEQQAMAADASPKLAKAPEAGSPLEALAGSAA